MKKIEISELQPFVRYVQRLIIKSDMPYLNSVAYDNRLFYAAQGNGTIRISGTDYCIRQGSIIMWRGGLAYEIKSEPGQTLGLLGCNFDMTGENKHIYAPVPPAKTEEFRREDILDNCNIAHPNAFNSVVQLENMQVAEDIIRQMLDEYTRQSLATSLRLSALLTLVLSEMARRITENNIGRTQSPVEEILSYIRLHYREDLTNREFGALFNYHPNYINQLVVAHTGVSLHQYLLRYRIQQSFHYLQNTDYPISKIAELTGFKDYNYFIKYFKKQIGHTPGKFRPNRK